MGDKAALFKQKGFFNFMKQAESSAELSLDVAGCYTERANKKRVDRRGLIERNFYFERVSRNALKIEIYSQIPKFANQISTEFSSFFFSSHKVLKTLIFKF